jgi:RNA polymerase sigma factor (TIGR02999 family)
LVHEAYLRLHPNQAQRDFNNRRAFFGYASQVMRSVVLDYFRERQAIKHGGEYTAVTLDTSIAENLAGEDYIALNDAMIALEEVDPRCMKVVELRFFGGLNEQEIADVLDISVPTVKRDWRKARLFLFDKMKS